MKEISEEEFNLEPARWQRAAQDEPVVVMDKGLPVLYLLSKEVFDSLYAGSRQALLVSELPPDVKKLLAEARVDPVHDHLNAELGPDFGRKDGAGEE